MSLEEKVQKYIEKQQLFHPQQRLLIALSGGGDSMALLHLMLDLAYPCEVAHVNFQLRGAASDQDEALVRRICDDHALVLHLKSVDTEAYAKEHKCSIEMAARDIRYAFFEEVLKERCLDYVLVAHHQDDVVETFFINLLRGTGLSGLSGMEAMRQHIVRPLLECTHQELLQYLEEHHLPYCTDSTNFDTAILRNKLRHDIIPEMETRKAGFGTLMQSTVGRLKEAEKVVLAYVLQWQKDYTYTNENRFYIDKKALFDSASPSELLYRLLQSYHFPVSIVDAIAKGGCLRVGARFYAQDHVLTIDRHDLVVAPIGDATAHFRVRNMLDFQNAPLPFKASIVDRKECFFSSSPQFAYFDADLLTFPFMLRRWKRGDVFFPFGMKGKQKKVSDFFIDNKVSQPEKEAAWLLCQAEDIMWVVGYRSDDRFRVSEATKRVLLLQVI